MTIKNVVVKSYFASRALLGYAEGPESFSGIIGGRESLESLIYDSAEQIKGRTEHEAGYWQGIWAAFDCDSWVDDSYVVDSKSNVAAFVLCCGDKRGVYALKKQGSTLKVELLSFDRTKAERVIGYKIHEIKDGILDYELIENKSYELRNERYHVDLNKL